MQSSFDDSLTHLTQLISDLSKARVNYIHFIERDKSSQVESEKLINEEREKIQNLETELRKAQDTYATVSTEYNSLKDALLRIGTQLHLKIKEVSDLKKDREEKLRLKAKVEEVEKQLNTKIEENLTMSKKMYSLTIERDHFSKKAKDLEHRQPNIEQDLIRSLQQLNFNSPRGSFMNYPQMSPQTTPTFQQPVSTPNNDKIVVKSTLPPSSGGTPQFPVFKEYPKLPVQQSNPQPYSPMVDDWMMPPGRNEQPPITPKSVAFPDDIDEDDIEMLRSMGFNVEEKRQVIIDLIRKHKKEISKVIEDLLKSAV